MKSIKSFFKRSPKSAKQEKKPEESEANALVESKAKEPVDNSGKENGTTAKKSKSSIRKTTSVKDGRNDTEDKREPVPIDDNSKTPVDAYAESAMAGVGLTLVWQRQHSIEDQAAEDTNDQPRRVRIKRIRGPPASDADLCVGDEVLQIDGRLVAGVPERTVISWLQGRLDEPVTLTMKSAKREEWKVILQRCLQPSNTPRYRSSRDLAAAAAAAAAAAGSIEPDQGEQGPSEAASPATPAPDSAADSAAGLGLWAPLARWGLSPPPPLEFNMPFFGKSDGPAAAAPSPGSPADGGAARAGGDRADKEGGSQVAAAPVDQGPMLAAIQTVRTSLADLIPNLYTCYSRT